MHSVIYYSFQGLAICTDCDILIRKCREISNDLRTVFWSGRWRWEMKLWFGEVPVFEHRRKQLIFLFKIINRVGQYCVIELITFRNSIRTRTKYVLSGVIILWNELFNICLRVFLNNIGSYLKLVCLWFKKKFFF